MIISSPQSAYRLLQPKFNPAPEQMVGNMVCATGNVVFSQGDRPEMAVSNPSSLTVM